MNYRKKIIILIIFITGICGRIYAEHGGNGDFVIFTSYTGDSAFDGILRNTEAALLEACMEAGRVQPVEFNYKKAAFEKSEGVDREDLYRKAAQLLKVDAYAVISSYSEKGNYVLKLNINPLNDKYNSLKMEKIFTSRIPDNLPLKAARDLAGALKTIALKSTVVEILDDGSAVIDSGQWNGLENDDYATSSGKITIKNAARYTSIASGQNFTKGQVLEFILYPRLDDFIHRLNILIRENTVKVYGTDEKFEKRGGSVKESIHSTCIINQGASFCLPGYGAFLSVEYMGIENGSPDYAGVFITSSLTVVHLGLVPFLTDFKVKFLPWVEDSGRSNQMKRLNYFLWGTLPLTFTASFYNQLAYQYREKNLLPPQFADHDLSASVVSIFIPGGGMFYKGYIWTGWCTYLAEMSMAGYAVYTQDKGQRNILIGSLAVLKCAEIILSYVIPPSYSFYNREVSSNDNIDFSISINKNNDLGGEITASVSLRY
jgi:hypothetical protein